MSTALRRVLIISPHWPPVNMPDMQRARLALPFLREHGWEPVVVAVDPKNIEGAVLDPLLEQTYPADIRVIRVRGLPARYTRWAKIGSLWLRCGRAVRAAAEALLANEKFDLVFFSTTQFDAFSLGPRWLRKFGVPYVLDYQDPWINSYYRNTGTRPPGGWLKFNLGQWSARRHEPAAVRDAAAIVTVSGAYGQTLIEAYPWLQADRITLLPFGATNKDFDAASRHAPANPLINFHDGNFHHVYVGRCGPDMLLTLAIIFRAFRLYLETHPDRARKMRFHFIGTGYAPPPLGRLWVMPIAQSEGIAEFASEHCYRVPYFDAVHYLLRADALLAIGSNDRSYSASKIFPYILAQRPLLVLFHEQSPVIDFANRMKAGLRLSFRGPEDLDPLAREVHRQWFVDKACRRIAPFDAAAFEPFTAAAMTARLAEIFDRAVSQASP